MKYQVQDKLNMNNHEENEEVEEIEQSQEIGKKL